jgi:hypothetical protein
MRQAFLAIVILASASCGEMSRQGTASSFLVIETLEGASGAEPGEFGGDLNSDVVTMVDGSATVFADIARVQFAVQMKDPGTVNFPNAPGPNNAITVDRYHVQFIRSDGRNTPGVDVPYPFDGAFTVTVFSRGEAAFTLVRVQAKREAPLSGLVNNGIRLSTIAEITFYGHDQTGREVSATGRIGVNFNNWGDPQ